MALGADEGECGFWRVWASKPTQSLYFFFLLFATVSFVYFVFLIESFDSASVELVGTGIGFVATFLHPDCRCIGAVNCVESALAFTLDSSILEKIFFWMRVCGHDIPKLSCRFSFSFS